MPLLIGVIPTYSSQIVGLNRGSSRYVGTYLYTSLYPCRFFLDSFYHDSRMMMMMISAGCRQCKHHSTSCPVVEHGSPVHEAHQESKGIRFHAELAVDAPYSILRQGNLELLRKSTVPTFYRSCDPCNRQRIITHQEPSPREFGFQCPLSQQCFYRDSSDAISSSIYLVIEPKDYDSAQIMTSFESCL